MRSIAVFTSGGDAPGMNACVRSVVRNALYLGLDVYGIKYGYNGMIEGDIYKMKSYSVSNIIQRGGTILKSARSKAFMTPEGRKKAFQHLQKRGIDGLVAIGGDGTFTGANLYYQEYRIPIIGIPGTIDNDLFGSDYTIGFDTAVNTALSAIDSIRDTANSHDRVFFIEVMGRNSGFIAIQCGIGGGAEMVMVPETATTTDDVIQNLKEGRDKDKTSSIIVVAEGKVHGNAHEIADRVLSELPELDIRVSTLGHVQRGGKPTAFDRILASTLGMAAVEGLTDGKKGVMVGIVNNQIQYTNFKDAITKPKPINDDMLRMVKILSI